MGVVDGALGRVASFRSLRSRNRRDPPQRRAPAGALLTHFRVTYVPERAPPLCPAQTRGVGGEQERPNTSMAPRVKRAQLDVFASLPFVIDDANMHCSGVQSSLLGLIPVSENFIGFGDKFAICFFNSI